MIWYICLGLSMFVMICTCIYMVMNRKHYRSGKFFTPLIALFIGVFIAVAVGMVPVFSELLEGEQQYGAEVSLFSLFQTLQIFTINCDAGFLLENILTHESPITSVYVIWMIILYIIGPLLTFGFIISVFVNVLTEIHYRLHRFGDVYIFSELNEKSATLASCIRENHKKAMIVFTGIDRETNADTELVENTKKLQALLMKRDILSFDFAKHSKNAELVFFVIGENEEENLTQTLKLLNRYQNREKTNLYVFASGTEEELVLSGAERGCVKVRRVDEVRSVIYSFLADEGTKVFESAVPAEDGKKEITAVVLGLGTYGTEMLKALSWFTQMEDFRVRIHAFDSDALAEDKFRALCPELMSLKLNGSEVSGTGEYSIEIHPDMDVRTEQFAGCLTVLKDITFVFVSLGDDTENISRAANVRMLAERMGCSPVIVAVVESTEVKEGVSGAVNHRGQPYGIMAVGDTETMYSEEIIMGTELERLALERHMKWGSEESFWQYEYNYRSSMASAIHREIRIRLGLQSAEKSETELTEEERDRLEKLEHRRWNAYMRSEGYVYSGSKDPSSRNDLGKMHHDLVEFEELTEAERWKDIGVASR